MGLADLVRSATSVADAITGDLQVTVSHKVVTARDSTQKPTAFSTTSRQCVFDDKEQRARLIGGVERVPTGKLTFPRNVTVSTEDQFVLPSGKVARVLDVAGPADPAGGRYLTEVFLGERTNA